MTLGKNKLFTGVNYTGDKFFARVVDTAEQLITGVVDTIDKHKFANISANFRIRIQISLGDTDS